jgi:hypothetical protein
MLRRELIFLHSASGDGCNDRPLLLATQEDFYRPVCIGSTGTFASPAQIESHVVQPKMPEIPDLNGGPFLF